MPTTGQFVLLMVDIAVLIAGGLTSFARWRTGMERLRRPAKICLYISILLDLIVIAWHSSVRGEWAPLKDNFGSLLWMAVLLSLFVAYTQRTHPLVGLEWFAMPIVLLLLVLAAVFGRSHPHEYLDTTWSIVHRATAYGGFVAFAVAGAVGAMYLFVNQRIRRKKLVMGDGFASLERLENVTFAAVTLGFGLLTIGLVSGLIRVLGEHGRGTLGPEWYRNPKVVLTFFAWVVYALVLHSPINPSFRGRRAALLSVLGLLLMVGVFVAVQYMPAR